MDKNAIDQRLSKENAILKKELMRVDNVKQNLFQKIWDLVEEKNTLQKKVQTLKLLGEVANLGYPEKVRMLFYLGSE